MKIFTNGARAARLLFGTISKTFVENKHRYLHRSLLFPNSTFVWHSVTNRALILPVFCFKTLSSHYLFFKKKTKNQNLGRMANFFSYSSRRLSAQANLSRTLFDKRKKTCPSFLFYIFARYSKRKIVFILKLMIRSWVFFPFLFFFLFFFFIML